MFNILIVDDESKTRDSIEKYIPWIRLGVDEVKTAKNGLEALEITANFQPDILLCDIRMPKMDGIELASIIRQRFPCCKLIFLSGFADKEYLKSAIHLKALQYIEKPIDINEIVSAISEAVTLLQDEHDKKRDELQMKNDLSQSSHLLRNQITLALISSDAKVVDSTLITFARALDFPASTAYLCASIPLKWSASVEHNEKNLIRSSILQLLSNEYDGDTCCLLSGIRTENDEIILILANHPMTTSQGIPPVFSMILKKLRDLALGKYAVCMGIGTSENKITSLHASYSFAAEAAKLSFYNGYWKIYTNSPRFRKDYTLKDSFHDQFRTLLQTDLTDAEKLINGITTELRSSKNIDPDTVRNIYSGLLLEGLHTAETMLLPDYSVKSKMASMIQELLHCRTLAEISETVVDNIRSILNTNLEKGISNQKVLEVIRFIHRKCADPGLNIQAIADHAFINQTYLCTLFKKITGRTLNDYINETRIENAKLLLKDSHVKLLEVAQLTGFSDPNYFATIFKKYAGCTPTQYRNGFLS